MIYSILVGALIGWIASRLMGGKKGLLRYLILGVAGSAVGNFLAGAIGIAARNSIGAILIGVPVGFVNVVESKELILQSQVPHIVARGRKGGSNVAAAICNALLYQILR